MSEITQPTNQTEESTSASHSELYNKIAEVFSARNYPFISVSSFPASKQKEVVVENLVDFIYSVKDSDPMFVSDKLIKHTNWCEQLLEAVEKDDTIVMDDLIRKAFLVNIIKELTS